MPSLISHLRRAGINLTTLALLVVLGLAFAVRIVGIDWDDGLYLHPDERHIVADVVVDRIAFTWPPETSWFDPETSPINPRPAREDGGYDGFAYGSFPVYVVDILGSVTTSITGTDWSAYDRVAYIGRALSIMLDTGTVLLVYLIGSRVISRTVGLAGSVVYAFLPIAIQSSHFFTVDSWLTFFIFASLLTGIDAVNSGSLWRFSLMSCWFGLALATKATAAPFACILLAAIVLAAWMDHQHGLASGRIVIRAVARATISFVATSTVFFLGEPFAFLAPAAYGDSLRQQGMIQSGTWDVPFTQQYVGTTRGAYQITEAVQYFLGPVAILLGICGAGLLAWFAWKRQSAAATLLLLWLAGFTLVILYPETKFPRYALPVTPALAICAGLAVVSMAMVLKDRLGKTLAVGFTALMLVISSGWGAAFAQVPSGEHTRVAASIWMFENLPPGSTFTDEIWDDRLPISLISAHSTDARRFDSASINLYSTRPTYGDIALLGPALTYLPYGETLGNLVGSGQIEAAVDVLNGISHVDFAANLAGSHLERIGLALTREDGIPLDENGPPVAAAFQFELVSAMARITTSPDLQNALRDISSRVALSNTITPEDTQELASAIDQASQSSTPRQLHKLMTDADYYVLASDRVERGMRQNPWRYAVPIRFYELLESGLGGIEPMKSFVSSPTLFGLEFPDSGADETFINYDHPVVRIYQKHQLVPYPEFVQLLGASALAQSEPDREPQSEPLTFDTPVSELDDVTDSRWSERITGNTAGALVVWLLLLAFLQAAAWPLARTVFKGFPDAGWGFSRLVGVIVPATVFWWLSSAHLIQFRAVWVGVTLMLFALTSWFWFGRREPASGQTQFRSIGAAEAVFWVTFLIFLTFKFLNPDSWHVYWGGEKPMEFAQINAILRSPEFPPVDPWYSQGFINYYYYSFYLVAFLIKATGIPTEIAFNLAQPTIMAILASTTFSVGAMFGNKLSRSRQDGILSGLLAVALVSYAGNMVTVAQLGNIVRGVGIDLDLFTFWVWNPSRAIVDADTGQLITEFPYFTGLYGDLHAHVVGMPLLVLCIGLAATFAFGTPVTGLRTMVARLCLTSIALGIVYPTNAWDLPVAAGIVAGGIIIGTQRITRARRRLAILALKVGGVAIGAGIVALPFLLHFEAPFGQVEAVRNSTSLLELESHAGGMLLIATATIPALFAIARGGRMRSTHAWLFAVLGIVLLARWLAAIREPDLVSWLDTLTVITVSGIWLQSIIDLGQPPQRFDFGLPRWTGNLLAVAGAAGVLGFLLIDRPVAALYAGIVGAATSVALRKRPPAPRLAALLVAAAGCTGAGVEVVFLADDLAQTDWARMNTVFKFYNQVWVLLAIPAAAAAGVLVNAFLSRLATGGAATALRRNAPAIATVATALVLTLSAAYPVAATGIRLDARFEPRPNRVTLDAFDWMEYGTVPTLDGYVIAFDEDRDVIDWFNTEVAGTPVIAEAAFAPYRCNSSRISIGTGLPSVLGWQRHEMQQRDPLVLPQRDMDLRTLYGSSSTDEKLAIIERYDIHYIVVGDLERTYPVVYGNDCVAMSEVPQYRALNLDTGIAAFDEMVGSTLEVAFSSGDTVVYRVIGNT